MPGSLQNNVQRNATPSTHVSDGSSGFSELIHNLAAPRSTSNLALTSLPPLSHCTGRPVPSFHSSASNLNGTPLAAIRASWFEPQTFAEFMAEAEDDAKWEERSMWDAEQGPEHFNGHEVWGGPRGELSGWMERVNIGCGRLGRRLKRSFVGAWKWGTRRKWWQRQRQK